ncbi:MAG TPA: YidC/Oxa1 family membrane protein insertase [Solirubrobacteraceae bacterium]|nr:YidC/Oxa1 family membrane protein insertase [Solirubrobacteraceae bacterium]
MPPFANVIEDAFSPLINAFEAIMVFMHELAPALSWGWAIVGLTVLIRALLVPVTYRQLKSMQEMQKLAPKIQALKEKYKDDKQRQQQEIMKFYQEHKVNPLASCLPFLLQLPVFISLFYMLRTDLKFDICGPALKAHFHVTSYSQIPSKQLAETGCNQVDPGSAKFLFIPDITAKATGIVLIVLIVVYVASQLASTLMATATADPNQRRFMLLLPLVIVAFLFRYPAGLLVYWITTNLWTIGQQYFIRQRMAGDSTDAGGDGGAGASNGKAKPLPKAALAGATVAGTGSGAAPAPGAATASPPPPPRRKKKRSGRRR